MGLTHVAMRKLGFLFDIPCGLFYISLFREAQGCNKCLVLRGNVRSSFQVDFAAAAKGGGGREVEEKRGRGSKARQGSSGPNLPGKQRPTRESLCPTVPYTECRMLDCWRVAVQVQIVSSNRMAARRACTSIPSIRPSRVSRCWKIWVSLLVESRALGVRGK